MNDRLVILVDYLGRFGSKKNSSVYMQGMDISLLFSEFKKNGFEAEFIPFSQVDLLSRSWKGVPVLYTSQEDSGLHYKSYIEDVVLALEYAGANLIPPFKYLRANNNKVFMEFVRSLYLNDVVMSPYTRGYGVYEEAVQCIDHWDFPLVIKCSAGAMSKGVYKAEDRFQFGNLAKKASKTSNIFDDLRELVRKVKYANYRVQSRYRRKFVLQEFIADLDFDWKLLIFGSKLYALKRKVRNNDFRASGSGLISYLSLADLNIPPEILSAAVDVKKRLDVPMLSLDFAWHGGNVFLLEFQAVYFGTLGQWRSAILFNYDDNKFSVEENNYNLEELVALAVSEHLLAKGV